MKKLLVILSVAATAAIPALLLPGIARSQESAGSDEGSFGTCYDGTCWGYGHEPGMMGPSYRAGMWEYAEGGGAPGMLGPAYGLGPIWKLDLSDAQRTEVKKVTDDLRRSRFATMGKLRDAGEMLREVEAASEPDPKKVGAAYAEVSKLRQDMLEATVQARNQVRSILTPAQRRQFDGWRDLGFGARAATLGGMACG